jgi:hypothetical protein
MLGTILGTGIGLVANGIGSWIANKRTKEAQDLQDAHYNKVIGEVTDEINANYLDRADSRNVIRKVTDSNAEALRQLNTGAIRGGATDEAKVAMASQLNKRTADVVGDLAALGEQRKDALRAERRNLENAYTQLKYQRLADTSGIDSILTNIGTAAQNLGSSLTKTPVETTTAADVTTDTVTRIATPEAPTVTRIATPEAPTVTRIAADDDNEIIKNNRR